MSTGAELIAAERQRQIDDEGWTPEHDAEHRFGELEKAAIAYIRPNRAGEWWPWSWDWFKPKVDHERNLIRAGALIAAEIDRLRLARGVSS